MTSFLSVYKDFVLAVIFGYSVFIGIERKNAHSLLRIIVGITLLSLIIEFFTYLFPYFFLDLSKYVFNEQYLLFFEYQYGRGRIFGDTLNEAFLPIFFFYINSGSFLRRATSVFGIILNFFSTMVSGWRTKAMIFLFGFITSLMVVGRKYIYIIIGGVVLLGLAFILLNNALVTVGLPSVVDRFVDIDAIEAKHNTSRFRYWNEAFDMGLSAPLFGVGLGNYFDNLSQNSKLQNMNNAYYQNQRFILIDDPHNLFFSAFANTGLIGLSSLLLLISYFFFTDLKFMFYNNKLAQGFILTFWSLFIFAFFNPWMYFSYLALFWFMRGVIEKIKVLDTHEN
ncbi:O-antigen ligase family protein [Candidatus Roizmanbacteria bacterium]|nr:O-antigen ligase family protein [Candidatus Roizmanbacteria bacterium]